MTYYSIGSCYQLGRTWYITSTNDISGFPYTVLHKDDKEFVKTTIDDYRCFKNRREAIQYLKRIVPNLKRFKNPHRGHEVHFIQ